jgi:hypothetical protein
MSFKYNIVEYLFIQYICATPLVRITLASLLFDSSMSARNDGNGLRQILNGKKSSTVCEEAYSVSWWLKTPKT